jgi:hypothetical protein
VISFSRSPSIPVYIPSTIARRMSATLVSGRSGIIQLMLTCPRGTSGSTVTM